MRHLYYKGIDLPAPMACWTSQGHPQAIGLLTERKKDSWNQPNYDPCLLPFLLKDQG